MHVTINSPILGNMQCQVSSSDFEGGGGLVGEKLTFFGAEVERKFFLNRWIQK